MTRTRSREGRRSVVVVSLVALVLGPVSAGADVRTAAQPPLLTPRPRAAAPDSARVTTDGHATLYSLAGTALPMAGAVALAVKTDGGLANTIAFAGLFWGGAIAGPSLGYVRGGASRRGLQGLALRAGMFALVWALAPTHDFDDGTLPNPSLNLATGEGGGDIGIWVLATAGILVSGVYDIIHVAGVVRDRTDRAGTLHLTMRPDAGRGGHGLTIEGRISF